jgi:hypothetical protein
MSTEQEFFLETGYNRDELIRGFILEFSRAYPHLDLGSVGFETIKGFLHQPQVIKAGTQRKMDLLCDYLLSQGLCEVQS